MTNSDQACLLISLVSGSPSHTDNVICLSPLSAFNSSHYQDICHCPTVPDDDFWLRQEAQEVTLSVCPSVIKLNSTLCRSGNYFVLLLQCEKAQIIDISSLFVENRAPDSIMMGGGEGVIITLPAHCPLMMTLNSQYYTVEGGADAAVI